MQQVKMSNGSSKIFVCCEYLILESDPVCMHGSSKRHVARSTANSSVSNQVFKFQSGAKYELAFIKQLFASASCFHMEDVKSENQTD